MILTLDASVAVKWVVDEPGSEAARRYLPLLSNDGHRITMQHTFLAPALVALELHNVLSKLYRSRNDDGSRKITFDQLAEGKFVLKQIGRLEPVDEELIGEARFMSFVAKSWLVPNDPNVSPQTVGTFNIYDCIYLAHAKRHRSTLLTADSELARIAEVFNIATELISVP